MRVKLTESVRLLSNGVSSDKESNPITRGVKISEREAVVSDGFIIVIKQLPSPEMELDEPSVDDGVREVIVPADAMKACKGDVVTLTTMESLMAPVSQLDSLIGADKKIVARLDGADFSVEADAIEGQYPDVERYFTPSPVVTQLAFNQKVIKKLLKTLPDDGMLMMRISDPDRPVEFQCADPDGGIPIRGLIMPAHVGWLNTTWKTIDTSKENGEG